MRFRRSLWIPFLVIFPACATSTSSIPAEWLSVPETPRHRVLAVWQTRPPNPASITSLTEPFAAVDSTDLSEERKEIVFSAKRADNFDVGLVSVDGSPISWIPNDPADEVGVQWAPRGHKVSYFVRGRSGDLVRTVHIPTSYRLDVAFPYATLRALQWEPAAERYAVAYDSVDASDRVEIMEYSGEAREMAIPPAVRLDVSIEPFANDALLLRPTLLRYSERLPLIVWVAGERNAWDDARGALLQRVRAACAVTTRIPDDAFWRAAGAIPWLDLTRVWIVSTAGSQPPTANAVVITADPKLSAGTYRKTGRIVTAPPAVVKSFAAGYIAGQLKGTSSPKWQQPLSPTRNRPSANITKRF